jgi:hypothetical protein
VRRHAILVVPESERPDPGASYGCGISLEDAADRHAIRQHVEIVITPLAGRPALLRAFKNKNVLAGFYHRHRFAPQSSSA